MKSLLKIKWENLLLMLLLGTTIYGWLVYFKYTKEIKMLVLVIITTFAFLVMLFSYKLIAKFRKQVLKFW